MQNLRLIVKTFVVFLMMVPMAGAVDQGIDVKRLNGNSSLERMRDSLKLLFTTQEDARQIEQDYSAVKKAASKWVWRYEQNSDSVAFRVNGKVQAYLKVDPLNPDQFYVNGSPMSLSRGKSYLSFKKEVDFILKKSAFRLENIFIQRADAFGFFALLIAGGIGYAVAHSKCKKGNEKCCHDDEKASNPSESPQQPPVASDPAYPEEQPEQPQTPVTAKPYPPANGTAPSCNRIKNPKYKAIPGLLSKSQVRIVAKNFKPQCPKRFSFHNPCFRTAADCVKFKMDDYPNRKKKRTRSVRKRTFNKNFSRAQVQQSCENVYYQVYNCQGPVDDPGFGEIVGDTPAKQTPYDPGYDDPGFGEIVDETPAKQ